MSGKFNNVRTVVDGFKFDSKGEAARYIFLKRRQDDGAITDLERQIRYNMIVNGQKICAYIADFRYQQDGVEIVEDFKSSATAKLPVFALKKKLMKACHGIDINIVMKADAIV